MVCGERARLEKLHNDAEEAFDAARKIVTEKIGITTREEFAALTGAVDTTWHALESAAASLSTGTFVRTATRTETSKSEFFKLHHYHSQILPLDFQLGLFL
jgi:hypothetical protein